MKKLLALAMLLVSLAACGVSAETATSPSTPSPQACDQYSATSVQTETKSDGATVTIMECKR